MNEVFCARAIFLGNGHKIEERDEIPLKPQSQTYLASDSRGLRPLKTSLIMAHKRRSPSAPLVWTRNPLPQKVISSHGEPDGMQLAEAVLCPSGCCSYFEQNTGLSLPVSSPSILDPILLIYHHGAHNEHANATQRRSQAGDLHGSQV